MPDAEQSLRGDIAALLTRPEFFPLRIDVDRQGVVFVPMSRQLLRRRSFLDPRDICVGPDARFIALDELAEQLSSKPSDSRVHFILHGAFCGSTLLARHFEELPHCLVLKEPHLLAQLAKLGNTGHAGPLESNEWGTWFDVGLRLLSRADSGDAAVLIKAPDQINWLANRLLDWDQRSKIIFLCAPLRVFLLSALKSEDRREWLRSRGRGLRLQLAQVPFHKQLAADELTDAQLGAAIWLLNSFLCANLLARADSDRILVMSSEELIHQPRKKFHEAVEFLGFARDEGIRGMLEEFSPITYYAKAPDQAAHFDAATRAAVLADIEERFGREVDAAVVWAKAMSSDWLSKSPFPLE
jgi:hypothetical protein